MKKIFTYTMMALMAMMSLTSCEGDDHYLAETLMNRDWQGYLGEYYYDRWGITSSGREFHTVMRFEAIDTWATSGRGYEVDYRVNSWRNDYAYCTFKWFIVDGEITLIYDDKKWVPYYIYDYHLNSTRFWGEIYDGTVTNGMKQHDIAFDFVNEYFGTEEEYYWDYYRKGRKPGGYHDGEDFEYQRQFHSREASADDFEYVKQPMVLDRTELVRQQTGISDAASVASGIFAEAMERK